MNYSHLVLGWLDTKKKTINNRIHFVSTVTNFLIFLNGNFNFLNIDSEKQVKVGNFLARLTTATRGFTGALDCYSKNNLIPFIGNTLELPTALFTNGYLLWLARGIPQSIRQVQGLLKRRFIEVVLPEKGKALLKTDDFKKYGISMKDDFIYYSTKEIGKIVIDVTLPEKGKALLKTDNFKKYGISIKDGFTYSAKEIGKIIKELFTKPFEKKNRFSHSMLSCSVMQFIGPIIAFFGLPKVGALLRDAGGVAVDAAYMMDPAYRPGGIGWTISAIADYAKLWDPISNAISNLTQFSNTCDPIAAIFESNANFGKKSDDEVIMQQAA